MSRKIIVTAVIAGLVGFIAGNAFWYLASPLWFDRVVDEALPAELQITTLASGAFRDADAVHRGAGTATVYESATGARVLRLSDFSVTNGPDLKVWLVAAKNPATSADVTGGDWRALGPLKGNIGDQTYPIPADLNLDDYGAVVIWCEQFSVLFAAADLASAR
ncbi:MAG: DM13 domain-containing protein [Hyphomicrobiales bacterium]|nr:DM13 domain-containing protein [Hyphomicrobiales bacterium]